MNIIKRIAAVLAIIYSSACGYMYFAQDSLIFKPTHEVKLVTEVFHIYAFLVGESMMRKLDPGVALKDLFF